MHGRAKAHPRTKTTSSPFKRKELWHPGGGRIVQLYLVPRPF